MKTKYSFKNAEIAVFDLDGTLIIQDSLFEQVKVLFRSSKSEFIHSVLLLLLLGKGI